MVFIIGCVIRGIHTKRVEDMFNLFNLFSDVAPYLEPSQQLAEDSEEQPVEQPIEQLAEDSEEDYAEYVFFKMEKRVQVFMIALVCAFFQMVIDKKQD